MAPLDAPLPAGPAAPVLSPAEGAALARAARLDALHGSKDAAGILRAAIAAFPGKLALVSSFGADAATLLHLVSTVEPSLPVIFIDTGKHFGDTLTYRDRLVARFGLTDVRSVGPDPERLAAEDPEGALWFHEADRCCAVRKVEPLARALEGFDAWITGRKRYQAATRSGLHAFEADGARVKVNPLIAWSRDDVHAYITTHDLPPHPLVAQGFPSIGCMPCTDRVAPGEDERAGRWRGQAKTECGIHLGLVGREKDGSGI
ncbi:phosphoadenylyl-sulfate reductase [Segnochrobactraceae bacterium EtOH-i3]